MGGDPVTTMLASTIIGAATGGGSGGGSGGGVGADGMPISLQGWLNAANSAKALVSPDAPPIARVDNLGPAASAATAHFGGQDPNLQLMQQLASQRGGASQFRAIPFSDWFSPSPKRW
ncbi:MAG: hypothetical protein P4N59_18265 [Negativicutes bacterium]|nr:hypothetical protein [Negativicutes bacterium]